MNIFTELQKFYVETQPHSLIDADTNFFTLALDIRKALGRQAYKFDEYLTMILRAANLYAVHRSVEEADADFSMIRKVCMDIIENKHQLHNHEYYSILKKHIDEHQSKFQDSYTLISLTYAL